METDPIYVFTSHVQGKNAKVWLYPDRIEWKLEGSKIARYTAATMTVGLSLLGGKKAAVELLPMKMVSSVGMKRDGLTNSIVSVTTSGGSVGFRVSHAEAEKVRRIIIENMVK